MATRLARFPGLLACVAAAATSVAEVAKCEAGDTTCGGCSQLPSEQLLLQLNSIRRVEVESNTTVAGYPRTGRKKSAGLWCEVDIPPADWNLKSCPGDGSLPVKVLSYNLFWWNLFRRHDGGDRSAGRLIARTSLPEQYDFMAFQECDDRHRVLQDAKKSGLQGDYGTIDGGRATALFYRKSRWTLLATSSADVGEDSPRQYYGKRSVVWARFRHRDGKTVFFVNHHGPLRVSEGGGCTGSATAMNIMRVIADQAHPDDGIVLVGDFNAHGSSSRIRELDRRLNRVLTGPAMGGIDHLFTNCAKGFEGRAHGKGDGYWKSDHNAISAMVKI